MTEEENEKRVRAFYEATVPGHRESLRGLQAPHVVYDMPEGMPIGCGHFEGLHDVLDRFLTSFYRALDVHFVTEEFISARSCIAVTIPMPLSSCWIPGISRWKRTSTRLPRLSTNCWREGNQN
ncbi:MAG: hypothetical protein ACREYE_05025 [Gammaproteobacteria bacterium]